MNFIEKILSDERFKQPDEPPAGIPLSGNEVYDDLWQIIWCTSASAKPMTYSAALAYAWQQTEADTNGYHWRLPTIEELSSLVNINAEGEAIKRGGLQGESGWYWSATPCADGDNDSAWALDFSDGNVVRHLHDLDQQVRLVRGSRSVIDN